MVEQSSDACKEFLKALHEGQQTGLSAGAFEIGKKVFGGAVDSGTVLGVFNKCKTRGWLLGTADAVWITSAGKKYIGQP